MATFPTIDFTQYKWAVLDQDYISKWNGVQDALGTLQANIDKFGQEVTQEKNTAVQAATDSQAARDKSQEWAESETEVEPGKRSSKYWAEQAADVVSEGVIDDTQTASNLTWSSLKIDSEIAAASTKATLTQSFAAGQQESITLGAPLTAAAVVSVTKETPEIGLTNNDWLALITSGGFDVEDTSYETTLTPSATTGIITLTLGTGSFASDDAGKVVEGNGGKAVIKDASGSAYVVTEFSDTSVIEAGHWSMKALQFSTSDGVFIGRNVNPARINDIFGDNSAVATYNLDGDAIDSGGNYNGTATDITYVDGKYGQSAMFNGTSSKIVNTTNTGLTGDLPRSYSLWVKLATTQQSNELCFVDTGGTVSGTGLRCALGMQGSDFYFIGYAKNQIASTGTTNLKDNNWHHVAMVYGSTDIKFFVDGNLTDTISKITINTNGQINIGYLTSSYPNIPDGSLDQVRIFNRALTETEVGELYNEKSVNKKPINQYLPALSNNYAQINSEFWTDINSASATETPSNQQVNYALSHDSRNTFYVVKNGGGARRIARYNAGTWECNEGGNTDAISVYTFDGGYNDLVGPNSVTDINSTNLVESVDGKAFEPNGSHATGSFTGEPAFISFWIKVNTSGNNETHFSFVGGTEFIEVASYGGHITWKSLRNPTDNGYTYITIEDVGTWVHFAIDVLTNDLYKNGQPITRDGGAVQGSSSNPANSFILGDKFDLSRQSTANLDNILVFNRSLTLAEVSEIYNEPVIQYTTNEIWTPASKNSVYGALSEAMRVTINRMDSGQLSAAADVDFPATGDTLDLAVILYTYNDEETPSSKGIALNYDANVLNKGAINGVDYEWDQPTDTEVRVKALKTGNYKARIV